jgi:PAS domain S-box-containing protein
MSGEIIEVNQRAVEFLGYERGELLGLPVTELHAGKSEAALSTRSEGVLIFTSEVITRTGRRVPVEVHAKTIDFGEREALQWIERDITEQVELEKMRRDMTAMLFHDLQSPLGNVLSSLELVEMELPEDLDTARLMLETAQDSGKRLRALIHTLLDIDRLEAGSPINQRRPVTVDQLLDDAQRLVNAGLERQQVALTREVAQGLPSLNVDHDMISRVILNLLDNALKYTPRSSEIVACARPADEDGMVIISIADSGPGIPEPYQRSIFDKFQRVRSDDGSKGLGLGLAFCRLAVEAHGGRIWVENIPQGGARFSFTVPTTTP